MRRAGASLLALIVAAALCAPWLAVHPAGEQHRGYVFAPPMPVHFIGPDGRLRWPFIHPLRLEDRLSRTYAADRSRLVPLEAGVGGRLLGTGSSDEAPWFPLGTDSLGRDVWSRLVLGARVSLGLAAAACLVALLLGALLGGWAGATGGVLDEVLMRVAEFVYVLPALYVVLVLRASLPLVLPAPTLFLLLTGVLAVVGWPQVARGVRAVVAAEAGRDYAAAARAAGSSRARVLVRHLLPASLPHLATQALLLAPAFILAEATLSYVGLGFMPPAASWGTMLQEAANVRAIADMPWVLTPAAAIAVVVLALNLMLGDEPPGVLDTPRARSGE
jgi:peptide/nickel transport system permease protein